MLKKKAKNKVDINNTQYVTIVNNIPMVLKYGVQISCS